MFGWVVKVVPQFPEPPGKLGDDVKPNAPPAPAPEKKVSFEVKKPAAPKANKPKDGEAKEDNGQTGMLTWISHGLTNALPQSPVLARRDTEEDNILSSNEQGLVGWIVHGLGKVIPQPDGKYKEGEEETEIAEVSKVPEVKPEPIVNDIKDMPDAEPLPHIPVVEILSDEEPEEPEKSFPPRVMEWIKQGIEKVVPQPEMHINSESQAKKEAPAPPPAPLKAPPPPEPSAEEPKENVVGWIVHGLGRMLPQPVPRPNGNGEDVQNRVKR